MEANNIVLRFVLHGEEERGGGGGHVTARGAWAWAGGEQGGGGRGNLTCTSLFLCCQAGLCGANGLSTTSCVCCHNSFSSQHNSKISFSISSIFSNSLDMQQSYSVRKYTVKPM